MASMLFKIYLTNKTQLYVCQTIPKDGTVVMAEDFRNAISTGLLEFLDEDGTLHLIPTCNIMHIECVPPEGDGEYDLERLFEEDDEDDDDYDDLDEEDEGDD